MSKYIDSGGDLLGAFPYSLARDEDKEKLAKSIADELARTAANTEKALIFPEIDTLPEELLDILAVDFKIDWYDVESPVWNKRQTVKECILVHKYKGTKFAVETALHSMFLSAEVKEWFEYSGEPYHFKVVVYGHTSSNLKKLNSKLLYAKNLRSVLDDVRFVLVTDPIDVYTGMAIASQAITKKSEFKTDDNRVFSSDGIFYFGAAFVNCAKAFDSKFEVDHGNNGADSFAGLDCGGLVASQSMRFTSSFTYTADNPPIPCGKAYISGTAKSFVKKMKLEVDFK